MIWTGSMLLLVASFGSDGNSLAFESASQHAAEVTPMQAFSTEGDLQDFLTKVLDSASITADEAYAAFDALPAMPIEEMFGRWSFIEVNTGHRFDGLLQPAGLHAKIFFGEDDVHPLVFINSDKTELYAVNPKLVPLEADLPKDEIVGDVIESGRFLLETKEPKARLRMVEFRGRATASMLYDERPIIDAFVKIDDEQVLGVMDMKGDPTPYFFILKRDRSDLSFGPLMELNERFMELFDMEVQNRAFALKVNKELGEKAVTDGDKAFYTAWVAFEEFLQREYAPFASKYGLSQAPRTGANIQVGLARLGMGVLPDDVMTKIVLEDTIKYLEKLKELKRVAPEEDAEFFAFVVKHEETQIEALRLRLDGNKEAATQLLTIFVAEQDKG
ncbi:MAG: DUF4334 domain-containing protein [Pseudomonadota bacterium]